MRLVKEKGMERRVKIDSDKKEKEDIAMKAMEKAFEEK